MNAKVALDTFDKKTKTEQKKEPKVVQEICTPGTDLRELLEAFAAGRINQNTKKAEPLCCFPALFERLVETYCSLSSSSVPAESAFSAASTATDKKPRAKIECCDVAYRSTATATARTWTYASQKAAMTSAAAPRGPEAFGPKARHEDLETMGGGAGASGFASIKRRDANKWKQEYYRVRFAKAALDSVPENQQMAAEPEAAGNKVGEDLAQLAAKFAGEGLYFASLDDLGGPRRAAGVRQAAKKAAKLTKKAERERGGAATVPRAKAGTKKRVAEADLPTAKETRTESSSDDEKWQSGTESDANSGG